MDYAVMIVIRGEDLAAPVSAADMVASRRMIFERLMLAQVTDIIAIMTEPEAKEMLMGYVAAVRMMESDAVRIDISTTEDPARGAH